ncbi:hypothetical protein KVV02_001931 [Mortierella alpina]|uniref:Uncharacterized protein n=1 Tax=Mortierella alpina TaxID=64518 RepID=A0A9P8ACI1_MORAP|nr:hypothetical protein KVV02_001931 [Mortierella alpina]
MSSPPVARSPPRLYQNQGGVNGEGLGYSNSNSKTQLSTADVDNPGNGFAPNNAHDYDALLSGATTTPVAYNNTTNDNAVNEINNLNLNSSSSNNGMASSTTAATTPTSMTANSANQTMRTSTSYMGVASGSGSSSGETTTSSVSPSATASAAIPLTMTIGGSSGVSEVKLKRFLEHNQRLREQLDMRRIPVSEASQR